jgi:hypothetical protein
MKKCNVNSKTCKRNKAEILSEALLSLMTHGTSLTIPITARFNMCYVCVWKLQFFVRQNICLVTTGYIKQAYYVT